MKKNYKILFLFLFILFILNEFKSVHLFELETLGGHLTSDSRLKDYKNDCLYKGRGEVCGAVAIALRRRSPPQYENAAWVSSKGCERMDLVSCFNAACYFSLLNKNDEALKYLTIAQKAGYKINLNDPDLKNFIKSEQFKLFEETEL